MKRTVDTLYGLKGYPNAARFTAFKTDLFANGSTPGITMDTATANGISVTAATTTAFRNTGACTTGLSLSGACTNGISITPAAADAADAAAADAAAANVTNFIKFNAAAGCILAVDVNPADDPSDGGLGADACLRIDVGGLDYFIPLFATELS